MKTCKKVFAIILSMVMATAALASCGNTDNSGYGDGDAASTGNSVVNKNSFDASKEIGVISRESGSGTRGAFIELFGIEQKNEAGEKVDYTTMEAVITNSTAVMMTSVSGDKYAIGYLSLGSLDESQVKAVSIDGVAASVENIKNGTYKIARPFNIVTKDGLSAAAQDFINYIMSADGQAVIENGGYIAVSDAPAYTGSVSSGKIVVSGSSSVTPIMEKLKEAYIAKNPGVTIEVQQSDSSTGVANAIDGTCDIGMASRELKDSEVAKGVSSTVIAMDGIAVIVNHENTVDNLTAEQVMKIFMGDVTRWNEVAAQ